MRALVFLAFVAVAVTTIDARQGYGHHRSSASGFQNFNLGLSKGFHNRYGRSLDYEEVTDDHFGIDSDAADVEVLPIVNERFVRAAEPSKFRKGHSKGRKSKGGHGKRTGNRYGRSADPEPGYHKPKSTATGFQNNRLGLSKGGYGGSRHHKRSADPQPQYGGPKHMGRATGSNNFNLGLSKGKKNRYGH